MKSPAPAGAPHSSLQPIQPLHPQDITDPASHQFFFPLTSKTAILPSHRNFSTLKALAVTRDLKQRHPISPHDLRAIHCPNVWNLGQEGSGARGKQVSTLTLPFSVSGSGTQPCTPKGLVWAFGNDKDEISQSLRVKRGFFLRRFH